MIVLIHRPLKLFEYVAVSCTEQICFAVLTAGNLPFYFSALFSQSLC